MAKQVPASPLSDNNDCPKHTQFVWSCGTCNGLFDKDGEVMAKDNTLREKLASIEHERWSDWQAYCHKAIIDSGGVIPAPYPLDHWNRQITTQYKDLTEKEKDSDREQVDRYLPVIIDHIIGEMPKMKNGCNPHHDTEMPNEFCSSGQCLVNGQHNKTLAEVIKILEEMR